MIKIVMFISLNFFAGIAFSQSYKCEDSKKLHAMFSDTPEEIFQGCACQENLKNVKITIPQNMKLVAACDVRSSDSLVQIDLKKTKVDFDKYVDGNYPYGSIFLSGKVILNGTVRYQYNDNTNNLDIYVSWPTSGSVFLKEISRLKIEDDKVELFGVTDEKLAVSKEIPPCITAEVTIEFDGLKVLFGGSDEAGTYPQDIKILNITNYQACD